MALIDEVRFSLRISTTDDTNINAELSRLINEAVLDLTKTSDIIPFEAENADALVRVGFPDYLGAYVAAGKMHRADEGVQPGGDAYRGDLFGEPGAPAQNLESGQHRRGRGAGQSRGDGGDRSVRAGRRVAR